MSRPSLDTPRDVKNVQELRPSTSAPLNGNLLSESSDVFDFMRLHGKTIKQQLEVLDNMMSVAVRTKEGAEATLNDDAPMSTAFRNLVESELRTAKSRIEEISWRIEERQRNDHDDFRTILKQASSLIMTLAAAGNPSASPSTSPGTSSSPLADATSDAEANRSRADSMGKLITILQKNLRVRYELDVAQVVKAVLPCLSDGSTQFCRATAYRLLRHLLVDAESVKRLREQPIDWYIVKSLTQDKQHTVEKEQAIKLIRAIIEIGAQRHDTEIVQGAAKVPLSEAVMRAFVAVAEQADDPFKNICVETLAEILLIDMELVVKAGGVRVLLQTLAEGPVEMTNLLTPIFLYVMDSPKTRSYLMPGSEMEIVLSGILDAYGRSDSEAIQRTKEVCKTIATMLRTWSGLMYFCIDDLRAIRALIDTLKIPSLETREIVLDMFFNLLKIKTPEWYQSFISGRRLTMYRKSRAPVESKEDNGATPRPSESFRLTDQYIALLIMVFTKAGLLDALTSMFEESTQGSSLSRKGTLLMAEILQLANKVLPLTMAAKVQLIPRVFNLASDYSDGEHRIVGTTTLSSIDSFNRNRARLQPADGTRNRPRANSAEDSIRRGQRLEQVKIKIGLQMEDKQFQAALLESQVTLTKDHTKWNFETLQELIEGPLLNPRRMEEAIKVSRFIRKLMSFFHPFSHRFSDIRRTKENVRWVRLGCSLLITLLASPDGIRYLSTEDDLLRQITRSFAQLDPFYGAQGQDSIFSTKRVAETLTYGYLEMLGTLSKHKDGIELMEKAKIFTAFYHLSELRSREDLIKGIIENMDYSIDGHPRIVLSKALTSSYKHIRLYATNHLGHMILNSSQANAWTLRLLLTQLYDPAMDVCEMATHFLEEACESMDVLRLVVAMQPTLDHLGEIGHSLLLRFMSTTTGFRYLYNAGYIDKEMDLWLHERNIHYVVQIEIFLAKAFETLAVDDDDDDVLSFDGVVPPHFFGEMAKTELGCTVLQDKGHFTDFALFIKQNGLEKEDPEIILKLKSILWAVGNVGSSPGGLPFLEEEEIIPAILEIAEQSLVLSVRGTCFFVLGLISSTPQGAETLDDYKWEATISPLGYPTGLCVPMNVDSFLSVPQWEVADSGKETRLTPPASQQEIEVFTTISNLSNAVIANTASRSLAKLKSRPEYQNVFKSVPMFYRALHIVSTSRYRLPVRRFIFDLFDIPLDQDSVQQLSECARTLAMGHVKVPTSTGRRRAMSVLFAAPKAHPSGSDEEEDGALGTHRPNAKKANAPPVVSLEPKTTIKGFDGEEDDSS
ncbi:Rapamycin-insensitive companion of mTOR, N-term-domain-containing protein [Vararia minispora EC-137]|uniref:Rapamycin-insensitive companion of mTOR, N-term-domain-containing protein n=1 Tax=Vararia minispora EC-137 TaxID=1314806 RepID=A0ACB8QXU0_9AGAM|nr:Rapamycin-insensitive companion of mTOR, N-term-domain-containing protein [Vararia minispora EC-137]